MNGGGSEPQAEGAVLVMQRCQARCAGVVSRSPMAFQPRATGGIHTGITAIALLNATNTSSIPRKLMC
jgi:hypothetical protein